jgi:hypothetical protein
MKHRVLCCGFFAAKKFVPASAAVLLSAALSIGSGFAQAAKKSSESRPGAPKVQQELVRLETGFFEAWKMKDQAYFRAHMAEKGIFWGEEGAFSRDQQLAAQLLSAKTCTVEGYSLSDFGALLLANGVYLLTYKAEQYATCNGEKLPVAINGSSVYVLQGGRWQAVYRAQVAAKN